MIRCIDDGGAGYIERWIDAQDESWHRPLREQQEAMFPHRCTALPSWVQCWCRWEWLHPAQLLAFTGKCQ